MTTPYLPILESVLGTKHDHDLFTAVFEHIAEQLGEAQWSPESDVVRGLPEVPRTVYYLFNLAAEVAGNGFEVFLLDRHAVEIIEGREALRRVGATQLGELLDAGIPLARECSPEFSQHEESPWFGQFSRADRWQDFATIDGKAFDLAADPLSTLCAEYIRSHRAAL